GARGDGTGGGGRRHGGGRTSAAHDPRSRRRPVAGAAPLGVGRGAVVDPRRVVAGGGGTHRGGLRPFGAAGPGRPGAGRPGGGARSRADRALGRRVTPPWRRARPHVLTQAGSSVPITSTSRRMARSCPVEAASASSRAVSAGPRRPSGLPVNSRSKDRPPRRTTARAAAR